jgi:hypothetical protein
MAGLLKPNAIKAGGYPQWWRQKTNISFQMPADTLGTNVMGTGMRAMSVKQRGLGRGDE